MTPRTLLLASILLLMIAFLGIKNMGSKPSVVTASFALAKGQQAISEVPEIQVMHSGDGALLLQLHTEAYPHATFQVKLKADALGEGTCVHLGDAAGNDGWGGDSANQTKHNAELQLVGPSGGLLLFGSDAMAEAESAATGSGSGKASLLKGEPGFAKAGEVVTFEIRDGDVKWAGGLGKKGEVKKPDLFAISGQAEDKILHAAFNRLIAKDAPVAECVESVTVMLSQQ